MPGILVEVTDVGEIVIKQRILLDLAILADKLAGKHPGVFEDFLRPVGKLPVPGHDVDAKQVAGLDHIAPARPVGGTRALPGVAAVEQQRAALGILGTQFLDQRRQVSETADLAEHARRLLEIQVGVGMLLDAAASNTEVLQQLVADQVRRLAIGSADAQIDVGLAEIDRIQLRMAIGKMQDARITECRHIVEFRIIAARRESGAREYAGGTGQTH